MEQPQWPGALHEPPRFIRWSKSATKQAGLARVSLSFFKARVLLCCCAGVLLYCCTAVCSQLEP